MGLVVLTSGVSRPREEIIKELIQLVREKIGPVAGFKLATVVSRLPKTRSGKILRGTMRKIADGDEYKIPATIDDPAIIDEITESLDELELLLRVQPETTGIVYDDDKLSSQIGTAQAYVGSSRGAPTPTALVYVAAAEAATAEILPKVDEFLGGELLEYREAIRAADIGLLSDIDPDSR